MFDATVFRAILCISHSVAFFTNAGGPFIIFKLSAVEYLLRKEKGNNANMQCQPYATPVSSQLFNSTSARKVRLPEELAPAQLWSQEKLLFIGIARNLLPQHASIAVGNGGMSPLFIHQL